MIPQTGGSQLPDTQGPSNFHLIRKRRPSPIKTDPGRISEVHYLSSQPSNSQPSQPSQPHNSMPAPSQPRHSTNIASLLNDETEKPQLILDEAQLHTLHESLVKNTSGCSLEQLEQINAALMDCIWKFRAEYNRNVVLHNVSGAFNEIIRDIQEMQKIMAASQELSQDAQYSQLPSEQPGTYTTAPRWGLATQRAPRQPGGGGYTEDTDPGWAFARQRDAQRDAGQETQYPPEGSQYPVEGSQFPVEGSQYP